MLQRELYIRRYTEPSTLAPIYEHDRCPLFWLNDLPAGGSITPGGGVGGGIWGPPSVKTFIIGWLELPQICQSLRNDAYKVL